MERSEQRCIAEALILASPEPIPLTRLASLIPSCKANLARELVDELNAEYVQRGRAFEIWEVAGGFQMRTLPVFAPYVQASQPDRPLRLSQAALETLAVIAYRQPATRAEIEYVRGVDAGAVLRSLLERRLVRIAGHREVPGRPLLYGTSRRFLEVFGLARIEDLPSLRELAEFAPAAAAESTQESVEAAGASDPGSGGLAADDADALDDDALDDELGDAFDTDAALGDADPDDGFDDEEPRGEPH